MANSPTIAAPTFVDNVPQSFFIEPLGGATQPANYLDRFPDEIYNKSPDSNLLALLYTLMGPAGFGWLLQNYLQARLETEDSGLSTVDLDALYTDPFGLARLAEETYTYDTNGLLTADQQTQVAQSDASYRNRALDFLSGARAGATLLGVTLAAQSGAGRPVEVIENYVALYDQYSDDPLGVPYIGSTLSTEEIIVVPNNDRPTSAQQTLTVQVVNVTNPLLPAANPEAYPTSGNFTLTLPLGSAFQSVLGNTLSSLTGSMTAGQYVLTVSSTSLIQPRMQVVVAGAGFSTTLISTVESIISSTEVLLADAALTTVSGSALTFTDPITTVPLPYNVDSDLVQNALQNLDIIGQNNVNVTGGPFPYEPLQVSFTGELADTPIPALIINSNFSDIDGDSFVVNVIVDEIGVDADGETAAISPQDLHTMYDAINLLKPVTAIVTTGLGTGSTTRQIAQTIFSDAESTQVLRYVTGVANVPWPPIDSTHWIQASIEHQAPSAVGYSQQGYQCFHNINNLTSYIETALTDSDYEASVSILTQYIDNHAGSYTSYQQTIYPLLSTNIGIQAYAINAQALPANPPTIETITNENIPLIEGIYPLDYQNLPNILPIPNTGSYWGSLERTNGQDYLEIDLGSVQVVNYISFEATQKPYNISISYDILDQYPARHFIPVSLIPNSIAQSITSIGFNVVQSNPWANVQIYFTNSLGTSIYTRFLRIEFTKRTGESSFTLPSGQLLPFSVEVQNLRVGRLVS